MGVGGGAAGFTSCGGAMGGAAVATTAGGAGVSVELATGAAVTTPTSQSLIVLSLLPEAIVRPSGEKTTDFTQSVCPSSFRSSRPLAASQSSIVLSLLPE